jgi:hypothetical protein
MIGHGTQQVKSSSMLESMQAQCLTAFHQQDMDDRPPHISPRVLQSAI